MNLKNDQQIEEYNQNFFKRLFMSLLLTFFTVLFSFIGIASILHLVGGGSSSVENSNTILIMSLIIGGMIAMFMCTFTILDEIRRNNYLKKQ